MALRVISLTTGHRNLQPHDTSHLSLSQMWEIRLAGSKGLGVFAKSFVPRGTRIFSERPLLGMRQDQDSSALYRATRRLSADEQTQLLSLSAHSSKEQSMMRWNQALWYITKQTLSDLQTRLLGGTAPFLMPGLHSVRQHVAVLNIFRSNAFDLGRTSGIRQAVFARISRINHSCIPNAQGNFHEGLRRFNVHAVRDIRVGEEVTLNYLQEHGALAATRQRRLLEGYSFLCDCPACDLTSSAGREGEQGRVRMHEVLRAFAELVGKDGMRNPEEELKTTQLFIELLEGQGVAGREIATMYLETAKLNEMLGKHDEALSCAERGLEIERDCLGIDHPLYEESLKFVRDLKRIK